MAARLVVVDLVQDAPAFRGKRPMVHAGRPAGIGGCEALLAALAPFVVAADEVALHHVDLFPVVVHERLGGEGARLDLQQARAAAALRLLVEVLGEDLLVEARRVAGRPFPAGVEIDAHEFEMRFGFHFPLLQTSSVAMAWCVTVPSYVMKRLKSSLAAARSGDAKARFIASSLSNSSCAISTALPRFTGHGSFQSTAVRITIRRKPGHAVTAGTWTFR